MRLQETKNKQLMEVMEVKRKVTRAGTMIGEMSRQKSLEDNRKMSGLVNPIYELDENVENDVIQEGPEA